MARRTGMRRCPTLSHGQAIPAGARSMSISRRSAWMLAFRAVSGVPRNRGTAVSHALMGQRGTAEVDRPQSAYPCGSCCPTPRWDTAGTLVSHVPHPFRGGTLGQHQPASPWDGTGRACARLARCRSLATAATRCADGPRGESEATLEGVGGSRFSLQIPSGGIGGRVHRPFSPHSSLLFRRNVVADRLRAPVEVA